MKRKRKGYGRTGLKGWWRWYKKPVLWVLVILWMAVIFCFSAQDGSKSDKESGKITDMVIDICVDNYQTLPHDKQVSIRNDVNFYVRKTAHFTEYFILGALLYGLVSSYTSLKGLAILIAWLAGTLYAGTDELHQYFMDDRNCQFRDVCIDSLGVLAGCLILFAILSLVAGKTKARVSGNYWS